MNLTKEDIELIVETIDNELASYLTGLFPQDQDFLEMMKTRKEKLIKLKEKLGQELI